MCAWTKLTDFDPSPTADATRLTDPLRTSPAANTPGKLVSSRNGTRPASRQRSASAVSAGSAVPGQHEALPVERHTVAEPVGVRIGADEEKQRRRFGWSLAARALPGADRAQMTIPLEARSTSRAQVDGHVLHGLQTVHQIARHARGQVGATHEHVDPGGRCARGRRRPARRSCRHPPRPPPRRGRAVASIAVAA